MCIIEKKHRLPKEFYRGKISTAFTLCLKKERNVAAGFNLRESEMVSVFTEVLTSIITKLNCIVPVYCFMPDHQHLIITGERDDSDIWKAVVSYKQKTGFWMSEYRPGMRWQKDFYDHVIRAPEDVAAQVKYILDNPVRKGLISSWEEYPLKGSIGCKLEEVLRGIV